MKKWSRDLPGLTKLYLDGLNKEMFQNLVNLEKLYFSSEYLEEVDSNSFAYNMNIRELTIERGSLTLNNQSMQLFVKT